ncbi:uncharacterized protein VP01_15580g1, partial [Puccinia sorghi]
MEACLFRLTKAKFNPLSLTKALRILSFVYFGPPQLLPCLYKLHNGEPVFFKDILNDLRSSFFDQNCQHRAKVALRNLRQTGAIPACTQDFNLHALTV